MMLTKFKFTEFKKDYPVYGVTNIIDTYGEESLKIDTQAKTTINVMWNPLRSEADIAEYGADISNMLFCILYDETNIDYHDVIYINDIEYEVVSIKRYNTHWRVDVSKRKVQR